MSADEIPPLDPELEGLLDAERSRPGPDASQVGRMLARLEGAIEPPPDGSPPDGSPPGGSPPGPAGTTPASAASASFGVPALVATFVAGVGAGALAWSQLGPTEPPISVSPPVAEIVERRELVVDSGVAATVTTPTSIDEEPQVEVTPEVVPAMREAARVRPAPTAEHAETSETRDRALADENALITRAQSALARGRPSEALSAVRQHEARFARGQFVEEREALWVQALAASGDMDAARERAARFMQRHPDSVLRPAVRAAIESSP